MEVFSELVKYFGRKAVSTKLARQRCRVSFSGFFRKRLVIDLDCCNVEGIDLNQVKRCDFIVFAELAADDCKSVLMVSTIELSRQPFSVGKIVPQLNGGTNIAEDALGSCLELVHHRYACVKFFPISFVGGGFPRAEQVKLARQRGIKFRSGNFKEERTVQVRACGSKLIDVPYFRSMGHQIARGRR